LRGLVAGTAGALRVTMPETTRHRAFVHSPGWSVALGAIVVGSLGCAVGEAPPDQDSEEFAIAVQACQEAILHVDSCLGSTPEDVVGQCLHAPSVEAAEGLLALDCSELEQIAGITYSGACTMCNWPNVRSTCQANQYCDYMGTCYSPNGLACRSKKPLGASCSTNIQCSSNNCTKRCNLWPFNANNPENCRFSDYFLKCW
jgi:hypothetical protein